MTSCNAGPTTPRSTSSMPTWRAGSARRSRSSIRAHSLTYGELQARTYQFAAALKALGLRQEDRLLLLLPDTVDYPVAFWGALRAGIVAIPLNTLLSPERLCLHHGRQPCDRAGGGRAARQKHPADPRSRAAAAHHRARRREPGRCQRLLASRCASFRRPPRAPAGGAVHRANPLRRGRVLDVHLGLDRRPQGRQARAHHADVLPRG